MKTIASFFILFLVTSGFKPAPPAEKTGTLTFKYSVTHIVKGYDHISKLVVYKDGAVIGESSQKKESAPNSVSINLPQGTHNIKAVLTSLYEGKWEEHIIANNYSIDCMYEGTINLGKKKTIKLVFDIDKGTIVK